jgi:RHS repeat-associated protein
MRAGGVGGVAWLQTGAVQSYSYGTGGAEVHVPLADHMGNVRHYYQFKSTKGNVTGQLVASYEYDAFGREVRAWGLNTPTENQPPGLPASRPWADLLPFHYSSKLRDVDSGFNYYGYRFYDPGAGRWLNRDPIGEEGGVNLYGMVGNEAINWIDSFGLSPGEERWFHGQADLIKGIEQGFGLTSSLLPQIAEPLDDCVKLCGEEPTRQGGKETKSANSERMRQYRVCVWTCMKSHPPRNCDGYNPPKKGPRWIRVPGKGEGWEDKSGDIWVPAKHLKNHRPHWDRQFGKGDYNPTYPNPPLPIQPIPK